LLLAGLVAAQTLPRARSTALLSAAAQPPDTAAQAQAAATPTPTPLLRAPEATAPAAQLPDKRDMARYEKAGTFSIKADAARGSRDAVMAQVRSFLLAKWSGKRLGHLVLQQPNSEGRAATSVFYVEPDDGGRWCVVLETAGGVQRFRFVEEIDAPEDGPPTLGPAPEGMSQGGRRVLHLKESAGARSGLVL
jgi:hypothetical protein